MTPGLIRRCAFSLLSNRAVVIEEDWDPRAPGCPVIIEFPTDRVRTRRIYSQLQFSYLPEDLTVEPTREPT